MEFAELIREAGIGLSSQAVEKLKTFASLLEGSSETINVTGIRDREGIWIKHFYDSLWWTGEYFKRDGATLLDLGTGGGIPGIPIKIAYPGVSVYMVDSVAKKIRFVESAIDKLGIEAVTIVGRAEELARSGELREYFDFVTARAVARLNILIELAVPFLKIGGLFFCLKGPDAEEETAEAEYALKELNAGIAGFTTRELPLGMGSRSVIVIKKEGKTDDKYPRRVGIPEKRPLKKVD